MAQAIDLNRRFGGIANLYGNDGLQKFVSSHIVVIGVGGVGSWACEALARSGFGELTLIDMDVVAESNINRQLPALDSTLGMDKAQVLSDRIHDINPSCKINIIDDFVTLENVAEILDGDYQFVLECIDSSRVKAAIINHCKRNKIPVITLGGAGGQIDPQRIRVSDLSQTKQDPLLSKTRKILRQQYNFAKNPKRRFGVPCIYSDEPLLISGQGNSSSALSCAGGLGSSMTVTASFALFAVAELMRRLSQDSS